MAAAPHRCHVGCLGAGRGLAGEGARRTRLRTRSHRSHAGSGFPSPALLPLPLGSALLSLVCPGQDHTGAPPPGPPISCWRCSGPARPPDAQRWASQNVPPLPTENHPAGRTRSDQPQLWPRGRSGRQTRTGEEFPFPVGLQKGSPPWPSSCPSLPGLVSGGGGVLVGWGRRCIPLHCPRQMLLGKKIGLCLGRREPSD